MAALVVGVAGASGEIAVIALFGEVAIVEVLLLRHGAEAADDADLNACFGGSVVSDQRGIIVVVATRIRPSIADSGAAHGGVVDVEARY